MQEKKLILIKYYCEIYDVVNIIIQYFLVLGLFSLKEINCIVIFKNFKIRKSNMIYARHSA